MQPLNTQTYPAIHADDEWMETFYLQHFICSYLWEQIKKYGDAFIILT